MIRKPRTFEEMWDKAFRNKTLEKPYPLILKIIDYLKDKKEDLWWRFLVFICFLTGGNGFGYWT